MTERERQKIEEEADQCLKQCESTISQLQSKISSQNNASQILDHRSRVLLHLWDIYGDISSAYFKQKSARLEISLEERMGYTTRHQSVLHASRAPRVLHDSSSSNSLTNPSSSGLSDSYRSLPRRETNYSESPNSSGLRRVTDDPSLDNDYVDYRGTSVDNLSGLDGKIQEQLRRENVALQTSLSSMSDDIRQLEQQMVVVAQAQQIIAHNLMQHRDDLEQIHKQTKDATFHISKGNSELEQAAQSGSKFRLFVLIFLLAVSFMLLLLHRIEN
jgi:hypothetical protein